MRDGGRSETISDGETKRADADELHQYVLSVGRNFDHWVLQKKRLPGIPASPEHYSLVTPPDF